MDKKKNVRQPGYLDEAQICELAKIQCTMSEIAAVMRCSVDTLERRFAGPIKEAREGGKSSLRRAQYQKALEGNATMLIWLGKHLLGQREEVTINAGSEPEVRALLEKWEVHAKRKADFGKLGAKDDRIDADIKLVA